MGCKNSKSTATDDQKGTPPEVKENGDSSKENENEKYVTEDEAVAWVIEKTKVTEERAKGIVKKVNKNNDNKIAEQELVQLWDAVSAEEKNMLELFKEHDKDNSGHVTQEEASQVLVKLLPEFQEENTKSVLKKFDQDNSGKLNYDEFCFFYASVKLRKDTLATEFEKIDADADGLLSRDDVINMLITEFTMAKNEADMLCSFADQNKDKKINKKEFENIWSSFFK